MLDLLLPWTMLVVDVADLDVRERFTLAYQALSDTAKTLGHSDAFLLAHFHPALKR